MKKTFIFVMALMCSVVMMAQEVDKSTVQAQAAAAQSAGSDLKKVDTGEKPWKFSGVLGLNAAATGLFDWAAGGNNNVNGVVYGRFRLLYHAKNFAWDTNLDMEYGLSWIDQEYDPLQKSSDKINFSTKIGWEFAKTWYLTGLASFQSQFAYGRSYSGTEAFDPIISKFMAPSYTDISVGIDWKPNDIFSVYLSPIAGRVTTVCVGKKLNERYMNETAEKTGTAVNLEEQLKEKYSVWRYELDENKEIVKDAEGNAVKNYTRDFRGEFGLSFKANVNYVYKDFKIQSTLGLFTPYAWDKVQVGLSDNDKPIYRDNNRRFGNFDVDWTTGISYQFLKCLQVTLSTDLRYYNGVMIAKTCKVKDDVEHLQKFGEEHTHAAERVQFKGVIGLGVGYTF